VIQDLFTYSIEDFIPFNEAAYWRLFEDMNASRLMLFPVFIVAIIGMIHAAFRGRIWTLLILLALVWSWVGYDFFLSRYARLNWAGEYFAWAFWAQAFLMLLAGLWDAFKQRQHTQTIPKTPWFLVGMALVYPIFSLLSGRSIQSMEFVGFSPDPTVLLTLGLLLVAKQRWFLLIIPTLWCFASGATAWVLGYGFGFILPLAAIAAWIQLGYGTKPFRR
jgi:hypothetical protein